MKNRLAIFIGVALLSAAALGLEVYLTRVYAIMVWSYMAFIVVSVALLGIGAAGSFLTVLGARASRKPAATMSGFALAFGATALAGTAAVGHLPFSTAHGFLSLQTHLPMMGYFLISGLPFFFSGAALGLAFRVWGEDANRLYFYDLAGAAAGAVLVVVGLNILGGAGTLALVAVLAAGAAFCFAGPGLRTAAGPAGLGVVAITAAVAFPVLFHIQTSPEKFLPYITANGYEVERVYWNALGRVEISKAGPRTQPAVSGPFRGMSAAYRGPLPAVKWITIDGGAETPVVAFDGDRRKLAFLEYYLPALAYQFAPPADVLIVGCGGGVDVLTALTYGAKRVDAVEINPSIVRADRRDLAEFNGDIFHRPGVTLYNAEGRSFVRASDREYDLLQLSLVDTFTASASGAHALSESYLYTVEAFQDYYRRLKPGGMLTVTRNYFTFPHESLRLTAMTYEALRREGELQPEKAMAVFTNGLQANVVVKKGGFNDAEATAIAALAQGKFEPLWLAGHAVPARTYERIYRDRRWDARLFLKGAPFSSHEAAGLDAGARSEGYHLIYSSSWLRGLNEFSALLTAADKNAFYNRYFYNVRPPRDDRPFFFLVSKWRHLYLDAAVVTPPGFLERTNFISLPHAAQLFLVLAFVQALVLSLVFILAPLGFLKREAPQASGKLPFVVYFVLLGAAFMFVEIPLIQKFILYLGHPVYAFAASLATLLAASGLGSFVSGVRPGKWRRWLPFVAVAVLAAFYALVLDGLLRATLGWAWGLRAYVTIILIAPAGFFMGIPFPLGVSILAGRARAMIPWAWAANGCASVLGPAAAVLMAITVGHNAVLTAAAVFYLLALVALRVAAGTSLPPPLPSSAAAEAGL